MIGNNVLRLNESTIIEAMQDYMEKMIPTKTPKVDGVDVENNMSAKTFIIRLSNDEGEVKQS